MDPERGRPVMKCSRRGDGFVMKDSEPEGSNRYLQQMRGHCLAQAMPKNQATRFAAKGPQQAMNGEKDEDN